MTVTDLAPTADPTLGDPVLDHPAWSSLTGRHAALAERRGKAARFQPEVAGFVGLADPDDPEAWRDLAELIGPGETAIVSGTGAPPSDWTAPFEPIAGVQFVDVSVTKKHDAEAVRLTAADVPQILDLIARTEPGPFRPRTIELGTYLGIKRDGALIAMAGERLQPNGWTEISAVCTDPAFRGHGLASRLVSAVAAGIEERGERVFLHTSGSNTTAIRLYLALGFKIRTYPEFRAVTSPPV